MMKKAVPALAAVVLSFFAFTGCGASAPAANSDKVAGKITVITQRTDIVDTVFKAYAAEFNKIYPDVQVTFEALSDYEKSIMVRMNTKDYGDVLLIPASVPIADIPDFFEPLGSLEDMNKKYLGIEERAVNKTVYGIPVAMNFTGIIYNKTVFAKAGITKIPRTPDEFLAALKLVKDKTDAVPLYTNYASGWALTQWEACLATVAGSPDYVNVTQVNSDDNFVAGQPHYDLYKVMYDAAKNKVIEKDPTTTDWESSKAGLANGKIAAMVLGSWAINQIKAVAKTPDDIAFMPFPTKAPKVYVPLAADYNLGINKNSENKAAAKAWIDWFTNKSNYAADQTGGMSPVVGAPLPATLKALENDYTFFGVQTPAKAGQEGLVDKLDKEAQIGFWQPDLKKKIIESAIGNRKESYDDLMKETNKAWVAARVKVGK